MSRRISIIDIVVGEKHFVHRYQVIEAEYSSRSCIPRSWTIVGEYRSSMREGEKHGVINIEALFEENDEVRCCFS